MPEEYSTMCGGEASLKDLVDIIRAHPGSKVCLSCLKPFATEADDERHNRQYTDDTECDEHSCWCRDLCWDSLYTMSCVGWINEEHVEELLREAITERERLMTAWLDIRQAASDFLFNSSATMQKSVLGRKLQAAINV